MQKLSDGAWTKERVLAAYEEWKALNDRAEGIAYNWMRLKGWDEDSVDLDGIEFPHWWGTGWPGYSLLLRDWKDSDDGLFDEIPLSYLWKTSWRDEMIRAKQEFEQTQAARDLERAERAELARLQAKYGEGTD